jgi:hypothetical protein
MLELDSLDWRELSHAYGAATDTPQLLKRIYAGPTNDDWADLYATIAHQGSISTAAYAAVPHVVAAGRSVAKTDELQYLSFVAFVLIGYDHKPIPDALRADYEAAIAEAAKRAFGLLSEPFPYVDSVYLLQAVSAFSGRIVLARIIEGIADGEFQVDCPRCSVHLYVEKEGEGLKTYGTDPIREPKTTGTTVKPRGWPDQTPRSGAPDGVADLHWLAEVGKPLIQAPSHKLLEILDGECKCPACGGEFLLYDELSKTRMKQ